MSARARRGAPRRRAADPAHTRRVLLYAAIGIVAALLLIAGVIPMVNRDALSRARAAWVQNGVRDTAPEAQSGVTRAFQERN